MGKSFRDKILRGIPLCDQDEKRLSNISFDLLYSVLSNICQSHSLTNDDDYKAIIDNWRKDEEEGLEIQRQRLAKLDSWDVETTTIESAKTEFDLAKDLIDPDFLDMVCGLLREAQWDASKGGAKSLA